MLTLLGCIFLYLIVFQVQGDNCPYDGELTAASTPSITIFNQSLPEPYDRIFGSRRDGLECTWIIEASDSDKIVRLNFRTFHFMNTTVSGKGDCVAIYDGDRYDTDSEHLIQELCNRAPAAVYNSTERHLTVVFRQGDLGGRRWMTMNYTMVTSPNDQEDRFWSSTLGRVLSFLFIILIFSIFSFIFKAWRTGSISEACRSCCDAAGRCVGRVLSLGSRCAGLFKSRAGGEAGGDSSPGGQHPQQRPRPRPPPNRRTSEAEDADIVTISGSNGSAHAPGLTSFFSSQGSHRSSLAGTSMADPPPDYSAILEHSASFSTASERSDSMRNEEEGVPDYASAVSFSLPAELQDSSHNPSLHPPPDDGSAPPSYELSAPPSYDSLFSNSNV